MSEVSRFTIREWSQDDRPREKLMAKGIETLSDSELLAILLRSGSAKETAVDLAKRMLNSVENNLCELSKMSVKEMCLNFKGIGPAKAAAAVAAFELGKRRCHTEPNEKPYLNCSQKIYEQVYATFVDLRHEECWVLFLNSSNRLLEMKRISIGGVSQTTVDPRIVMKHAVQLLATSMVLCHNHPSGNTRPSDADNRLTASMRDAAKILGIVLLDHLIICDGKYYSYADQGLI